MKKYKSTGFWLSLTGAILLVIQQIGIMFGFNVNSELVNNIVSSVCSVLVVLGVLIPSNTTAAKQFGETLTNDINNINSKKD